MNEVDWNEIFKPLIDHITGYFKDNDKGPGGTLFSDETLRDLNKLITSVNKDYKEYWKNEMYDGSQEQFLSAFKINANYDEIMDCVRSLIDISDNVSDEPDFGRGVLKIEVEPNIGNSTSDIVDEIIEVHSKLKMLECDFVIYLCNNKYIENSGLKIRLDRSENSDVVKSRLDNTNWKRFSGSLNIITNMVKIYVFIYNKETSSFVL